MSLPSFRDYARSMANDADLDLGDRALWTQLADEIDEYLAIGDDPTGAALDLFDLIGDDDK